MVVGKGRLKDLNGRVMVGEYSRVVGLVGWSHRPGDWQHKIVIVGRTDHVVAQATLQQLVKRSPSFDGASLLSSVRVENGSNG